MPVFIKTNLECKNNPNSMPPHPQVHHLCEIGENPQKVDFCAIFLLNLPMQEGFFQVKGLFTRPVMLPSEPCTQANFPRFTPCSKGF